MADRRRLPASMLVDLPNWIGDQMMAMPALVRLVEANTGGDTVLHTRPPMVRLLESLFPTCRVAASRRKASPFRSARVLRGGGRFEIGVTLRNSARAKILLRLASRWCAGSRGEGGSLLLSVSRPVDRSRHQVHDADPILEVLGLDGVDPDRKPGLPAGLRAEGASLLGQADLEPGKAIGLAPSTARGTDKRWPVDAYGELASRLLDHGLVPVVVVGPGEGEVARAVCSAAGRRLPVLGESADVAGLAGLVTSLRAVVGNDSGPVQTAALFGTPVVAIFGPTDPVRTAPLGSDHKVLRGVFDVSDPGSGVAVEDSLAAVLERLSGGCRAHP